MATHAVSKPATPSGRSAAPGTAAPKPVVAIVGRPNVGKSSLFNRLIGQRRAIVEDVPGTTRDRLYGEVEWAGRTFTLIDTGGLELASPDSLAASIAAQVRLAIEEADVILLATDSEEGLTAADEEIAQQLRAGAFAAGRSKPVIVVPGKADNARRRDAAAEFYTLGFEEVIPVSAYHGANIGDLLDAIVAALPPLPPEVETAAERIKVAIVGRPNVGKSSLLNRLLGEERVVVSEAPGTTRDAIDTEIEHDGRRFLLIDTAGIRRRGRIAPGIEKYSVLRALRAIERADVALLVVDATEFLAAQDLHIAGEIERAGKGIVLVVNKWDLVEKDSTTQPQYQQEIARQLNFMPWVPVLFVSALTGQRVQRVLEEAVAVHMERQKRIPTAQLNEVIGRALETHAPPARKGRPVKIYYATQVEVTPPTFLFFMNDPQLVHFSLERFLENTLRQAFGFRGTPIRLHFRARRPSVEQGRR